MIQLVPLQSKNSLLQFFSSRAMEFIFPSLCFICDTPASRSNKWFCETCLSKLIQNNCDRDVCGKCGQNLRAKKCACEFVWDNPFERIFALLDYDEIVKDIVHGIKYRGLRSLAYDMGRLLNSTIPATFWEDVDMVIPVPLYNLRLWRRGYNQAEWLARGIMDGASVGIPFNTTVLKRNKHTRTQTKLTKEQRRKNCSKAFFVDDSNRPILENKRVVVIDDVITTGSTTSAITQKLLEAGCKGVRVLALARD